nr:ABC transporter ATP-binding protein [uncultured Acetatifactor sp.]
MRCRGQERKSLAGEGSKGGRVQMDGAMVEMEDVRAGYGKAEILRGVDFRAESGEITTIIGTNGSGKSTLLRTLLGFLPMRSGDIRIDGISIKDISRTELARRIAYLPQGKNVPDISAGRMVLHGRFPYLTYPRKYREADVRIARQAMEQMGVAELSEQHMSRLSGGMRQKVYIAMALAGQAPVIVMDEPTTYLDIGQQVKFAETVRQLSKEGKTVVLVLHDILLALKISARIAALGEGKVIWSGTPGEMLEQNVSQRLYGVAVGAARTDAGTQYFYEYPSGD